MFTGPNIIKNGLVLCLDAANTKSYPTSGTTWTDLSGQGNNGTLINGPTFNSSNNGSLVFDGVNDRVDFLDTSSTRLTGRSESTVIAWFRRNGGLNSIRNIFSLGIDNTFRAKLLIQLNSSNNIVLGGRSISTENLQVKVTTSTFVSNDWTFVCGTINLTTNDVKIYINDQETSTTGTINFFQNTFSNETPLRNCIGSGTALEYFFLGNIPTVFLYNRALTASEVLQNYEATKSRYNL